MLLQSKTIFVVARIVNQRAIAVYTMHCQKSLDKELDIYTCSNSEALLT